MSSLGISLLLTNVIFYSLIMSIMFFLYIKNNVKLLTLFVQLYYISLSITFLFHNSIIIFLLTELNIDYSSIPFLHLFFSLYTVINFFKKKDTDKNIRVSIHASVIFFGLINLCILDDDTFHHQLLYIIYIYCMVSSIIYNFLTICILYFKSFIDSLLYQHNLYEINNIVNEDCSICLEPLNTNVIKTKCNHHFHRGCIVQSLTIKTNCPLCRTEIV